MLVKLKSIMETLPLPSVLLVLIDDYLFKNYDKIVKFRNSDYGVDRSDFVLNLAWYCINNCDYNLMWESLDTITNYIHINCIVCQQDMICIYATKDMTTAVVTCGFRNKFVRKLNLCDKCKKACLCTNPEIPSIVNESSLCCTMCNKKLCKYHSKDVIRFRDYTFCNKSCQQLYKSFVET